MTTRLRRALLATLIFTAWAAVPVVAADPPPAATMEGHPALPRAPRHTMTKQGRQGDPVNIAFVGTEEELHRALAG